MFFRRSVSALAVATLLCATNAAAQTRHVVAPDVLRQTMTAQLAAEAANREAIREVFHHDQVRDVASRLGLTVVQADAAVATMSGADLADAAAAARTVHTTLTGGSNTVIISTTTLLLILIIVLLVAN